MRGDLSSGQQQWRETAHHDLPSPPKTALRIRYSSFKLIRVVHDAGYFQYDTHCDQDTATPLRCHRSPTHLFDFGVGTAVEHEPREWTAGSGAVGRHAVGVCLAFGTLGLHVDSSITRRDNHVG